MKNSGTKKFFKIFATILAIYAVLAISFVFVYTTFFASSHVSKPSNPIDSGEIAGSNKDGIMDTFLKAPKKTSFLLIGVDETERLSDFMVVGSFDSEANTFDMISIPRDTYVYIDDTFMEMLNDDDIYPPRVLKMNELHSYAEAQGLGTKYLEYYLSNSLGITFDYYAKVNLEGFRNIVDAVGGIEMDIRPEGYHYKDPTQNLVINVPGGHQVLDGKAAEGVVRFRADYRLGDVQRIEIQQEFMKAFFDQVLNKKTLLSNAPEFVSTIFTYMTTDFPISEVPRYASHIPQLSSDKFTITVLPGEGRYVDGKSYFFPDEAATEELVAQTFYSTKYETLDGDITKFRIQLLNGSKVKGLATEKSEELKEKGYNVTNVGNSTDPTADRTIIKIRQDVDLTSFTDNFNDPEVVIDSTIPAIYDMVIILGSNESLDSTAN